MRVGSITSASLKLPETIIECHLSFIVSSYLTLSFLCFFFFILTLSFLCCSLDLTLYLSVCRTLYFSALPSASPFFFHCRVGLL